MVRVASLLTCLVTMTYGAQAANWYCQCLYANGSHCCVIDNASDCTASCLNAVPLFENTGCNAGGKNSKVSYWNSQFRAACKEQ